MKTLASKGWALLRNKRQVPLEVGPSGVLVIAKKRARWRAHRV